MLCFIFLFGFRGNIFNWRITHHFHRYLSNWTWREGNRFYFQELFTEFIAKVMEIDISSPESAFTRHSFWNWMQGSQFTLRFLRLFHFLKNWAEGFELFSFFINIFTINFVRQDDNVSLNCKFDNDSDGFFGKDSSSWISRINHTNRSHSFPLFCCIIVGFNQLFWL